MCHFDDLSAMAPGQIFPEGGSSRDNGHSHGTILLRRGAGELHDDRRGSPVRVSTAGCTGKVQTRFRFRAPDPR
ncbi:hypothetical protein HNQ99_003056 [Rhizorhapis suberifaciens]|uniref:Uncharacterized protein n=1 Tax=Rhizorhapis suberifaciens TaxID=13656 RepID=A0A840HYS8_9SPHN|nr:hypothetical protein [Rhizorhapis suberifaciens]